MNLRNSIGIFDSGVGGLTIFKAIAEKLPDHNFIYLGDNARSPYGERSFDAVYQYTLECVEWLFEMGCSLVVVACNTASAKALKNIQQLHLPIKYPHHRVLGVIRPTAEIIGNFTVSKSVGILGTKGTVNSNSYQLEINKFFPAISVYQQSCPMWVTLIESGIYEGSDVDRYVAEYVDGLMQQSKSIDTILLACTHYPLLLSSIEKYVSPTVKIVSQGSIVAERLVWYLDHHPEINGLLGRSSITKFFTTGVANVFDIQATRFLEQPVASTSIKI